MELIEAFPLLIHLDPRIVPHIRENLIFSLQAKLIAKLAAALGTHDVMMALLAAGRLERPLRVIEDPIAVQATALEVAMVVVGDYDDLLGGLHLLDDFEVGAVENLDVALVEGHQDEPVVAECVIHLELSWHFLAELQLITGEEVKLHFLVLADHRVDAHKLDELGRCV